MKTEIQKRFVSALRSGEYKKSDKKFLRDINGNYCALGVFCDSCLEGEWVQISSTSYRFVTKERPDGFTIKELSTLFFDGSEAVDIINMNDDGFFFTEIADAIEQGKHIGYCERGHSLA